MALFIAKESGRDKEIYIIADSITEILEQLPGMTFEEISNGPNSNVVCIECLNPTGHVPLRRNMFEVIAPVSVSSNIPVTQYVLARNLREVVAKLPLGSRITSIKDIGGGHICTNCILLAGALSNKDIPKEEREKIKNEARISSH